MILQRLDENLWLYESTVRFAGIPLPHTMTIIRLPTGGLFVHSPKKLDPSTMSSLESLGVIDSIVWPSWWHDMYLREYAEAYPQARLFGAPMLVKWHRQMSRIRSLDA